MERISHSRAKAARPIGTVGLTVKVKPETVDAVDCWSAQLPPDRRPASRGDAVRQLLDETLEGKDGGSNRA
jgi:hypothetical protein